MLNKTLCNSEKAKWFLSATCCFNTHTQAHCVYCFCFYFWLSRHYLCVAFICKLRAAKCGTVAHTAWHFSAGGLLQRPVVDAFISVRNWWQVYYAHSITHTHIKLLKHTHSHLYLHTVISKPPCHLYKCASCPHEVWKRKLLIFNYICIYYLYIHICVRLKFVWR